MNLSLLLALYVIFFNSCKPEKGPKLLLILPTSLGEFLTKEQDKSVYMHLYINKFGVRKVLCKNNDFIGRVKENLHITQSFNSTGMLIAQKRNGRRR